MSSGRFQAANAIRARCILELRFNYPFICCVRVYLMFRLKEVFVLLNGFLNFIIKY